MGSLLCCEYLTINLKMNLFRSKQQIKPPLPGKYIRTINCFIWIVELLKRSYLYSLSTFEKCNDHHAHVNKFDFLIRIQVIVQLAIGIEQFTDSAVQERNMAIILRLLSAYFGWKGDYVLHDLIHGHPFCATVLCAFDENSIHVLSKTFIILSGYQEMSLLSYFAC